jgi:hypothetical protein
MVEIIISMRMLNDWCVSVLLLLFAATIRHHQSSSSSSSSFGNDERPKETMSVSIAPASHRRLADSHDEPKRFGENKGHHVVVSRIHPSIAVVGLRRLIMVFDHTRLYDGLIQHQPIRGHLDDISYPVATRNVVAGKEWIIS